MKQPYIGRNARYALALLVGLGIVIFLGINGFQKTAAQTPADQATVEGKIELASDGDLNKNGKVDAGDTVMLQFTITNHSEAEYPFATLLTGVNYNLLYDLWNLQGAASVTDGNNTLTFPNLWVPAHAVLNISVEATLKYFVEGEERFTLSPQLLDRAGRPVGTVISSEHAQQQVNPWVGELPPWIATPGTTSPSPLPTPTLSPTPLTTPVPTPTPSPLPEVSPTPTPVITASPAVEPTPLTTPVPTPVVSPTVEPSPSASAAVPSATNIP